MNDLDAKVRAAQNAGCDHSTPDEAHDCPVCQCVAAFQARVRELEAKLEIDVEQEKKIHVETWQDGFRAGLEAAAQAVLIALGNGEIGSLAARAIRALEPNS